MITNHLTMVTIVPLIIGKLFTEVEPNICACCCGNRGWSRRLNRSHRCCCCFCCCCWCCSCCSNNSGWIYAFTCLDKKQIYVRKNNNRITINKRTNHQSVWYFLFTKKNVSNEDDIDGHLSATWLGLVLVRHVAMSCLVRADDGYCNYFHFQTLKFKTWK